MPANVLIVTATSAEAEIIERFAIRNDSSGNFIFGDISVNILITGVGTVATAWAMTKWLKLNPLPDLAVNAGIAGSYREEIIPGDVVMPVTDCFADAGVETGEGFMTLAEAGLEDPDRFPFNNGRIVAANRFVSETAGLIKPVAAITVNTISGYEATIDRLRKKYNPDIETMEGAAFFYVCSSEKIPFMALRAISNRVEPRNRETWNIRLALDNLELMLKEMLVKLD